MSLLKTNISYAGKDVNLIIREFLAENTLASNFNAKVISTPGEKYVFHDISDSLTLGSYECEGADNGNITLNQRSLELCTYQLQQTICHDVLINTYRETEYGSDSMSAQKFDQTEIAKMIIEHMIETAADQIDQVALLGRAQTGGSEPLNICDGLLFKFSGDSTVVKVSGTTGLTASNVIDAFNSVYNQSSKKIKNQRRPERKGQFAVSSKIADLFLQYMTQQGNGFNFYSPDSSGNLAYIGHKVVVLENLPDHVMFFTTADNIHLVYQASDWNTLNITDVSLSDSRRDIVTIKLKGRFGVGYGFGEYVTIYGLNTVTL